jgi:GDP-L-fucose synthase
VSGEPSRGFWEGRPVTVTGGAGFLGRFVVRRLEESGAAVTVVRSATHDLRDPDACREALAGADIVFHLAANVGGIDYNRRHPGPLLHDNLAMGLNVFEQSRLAGVKKLICAGSVCAYPKHTPAPFREDDLWNGYPEESNAPYGIAKKTLIVLADSYSRQYGFEACVPVIANLYGPGDNFDLRDSHVIAAMIRKFVEAVERGESKVTLWGSGEPSREFLFVDDAARAMVLAAERLDRPLPVNVGTGVPTRIAELARLVRDATEFEGRIEWDASMPDGQPTRYLDTSRARELFGFEAEVPLAQGLARTISAYRREPVGSA